MTEREFVWSILIHSLKRLLSSWTHDNLFWGHHQITRAKTKHFVGTSVTIMQFMMVWDTDARRHCRQSSQYLGPNISWHIVIKYFNHRIFMCGARALANMFYMNICFVSHCKYIHCGVVCQWYYCIVATKRINWSRIYRLKLLKNCRWSYNILLRHPS